MKWIQAFLTGLIFHLCLIAQGQDTSGLRMITFDTLQLSLKAPKVFAFKTADVVFLMDYQEARKVLTSHAKNGLLKELAKRQLDSVEKQISQSDTAFLDGRVFSRWGWVPFNQLLCELLLSQSCLIEDSKGRRHSMIIRMHGFVQTEKVIEWSGWRFFLPGRFEYFFECTEMES